MTLGSDSTADRARLGFSNKGGLVEGVIATDVTPVSAEKRRMSVEELIGGVP